MSVHTPTPAIAMPMNTRASSPQGDVPAASSSFAPSQAPIAIGTATVTPTWPRIAAFERAPPGERGAAKARASLPEVGAHCRAKVLKRRVCTQPEGLGPCAHVPAVVDDRGLLGQHAGVLEDRRIEMRSVLVAIDQVRT